MRVTLCYGRAVPLRLRLVIRFSFDVEIVSGKVHNSHRPFIQGDERNISSLDYARGHETILLVEDEELLRHVILDMLGQLGYRVLGAKSGKEALVLAEEYPGKIDVLVTDVLMPDLPGPQLADSLRCSRPDLKVIFVSGDMDADHSLAPESARLHKPFTIRMLSSKLREVLQA
jgi:two-component system, cell cycle sensor histidine kinase and response regulator CckA